MRRISIFAKGFGGPQSPNLNGIPNSPGPLQALSSQQISGRHSTFRPQTKGSSWRNWWISSGGWEKHTFRTRRFKLSEVSQVVNLFVPAKLPILNSSNTLLLCVFIYQPRIVLFGILCEMKMVWVCWASCLQVWWRKVAKVDASLKLNPRYSLRFSNAQALLNTEVRSDSKSYLL